MYMKTCLVRDNFNDLSFLSLRGINLIKGVTPTVIDVTGNIIENCNYVGINDECQNPLWEFDEKSYLLIPENSATVLFDITETITVDRVIISGFFEKNYDFTLFDYEVFISDNLETLFDKKSNAISYINKTATDPECERNNCDQVFDLTDYRGRYLAIRINKSNNDDGIIRLGSVYFCNNDVTDSLTFAENTFAQNLVSGVIPTVKGSYTADLSFLTDGICFDEKKRVYLNCETEYIFALPKNTNVTSLGIVGSQETINDIMIYAGKNRDDLINENNLVQIDILPCSTPKENVSAALITLTDTVTADCICIKFPVNSGFLDQIIIEGDTDFPNISAEKL